MRLALVVLGSATVESLGIPAELATVVLRERDVGGRANAQSVYLPVYIRASGVEGSGEDVTVEGRRSTTMDARPPKPMIPVDLVLQAYQQGWFPMGDDRAPGIEWYSPDPRGVLPLDAFHAPSRLERVIRQGRFDLRINQAFPEVLASCAARGET